MTRVSPAPAKRTSSAPTRAPGQSLPQGLAAGSSRIHAPLPLPPTAGSPSPAAFGGTSPGYGEWHVSWGPGFLNYMSSTKPAPAPAAAWIPQRRRRASWCPRQAPTNAGSGLETMFSQWYYLASAHGDGWCGRGARGGGVDAAQCEWGRKEAGWSR
ncbi:hypothetical protein B0H19DRAFT_1070459 [Mycena capillaripes]|nr:hypothetical protein B0H19DRAFT_1070459 [Mycena capillaripes]